MTETLPTLEIRQSPFKLLVLTILGIVMTALSAAIALRYIPVQRGSFAEFASYVGVVLFGLATLLAVWRLLVLRGPVVVLSSQGILDRRVAAEPIPWTAIQNVSTWHYGRQKIMVLAVDPDCERRLTLSRIARWSRGPNRALGVDGLCVAATGLEIDHTTLLATTVRYAEAAQRA